LPILTFCLSYKKSHHHEQKQQYYYFMSFLRLTNPSLCFTEKQAEWNNQRIMAMYTDEKLPKKQVTNEIGYMQKGQPWS
jgi:hypothetical protein